MKRATVAMGLRGVHEEGVAEVHRARPAGREHFRPVRRPGETIGRQLAKRQPGFAGWGKLPGDVDV